MTLNPYPPVVKHKITYKTILCPNSQIKNKIRPLFTFNANCHFSQTNYSRCILASFCYFST